VGSPDNADLAEFLSRESEDAPYPLQRALRNAARRAFLWPEQAADLVRHDRSLTELSGIGPYLEKKIRRWLEKPELPDASTPLERRNFLCLARAKALLTEQPSWMKKLRGDLQMHTEWSDGSGTIAQMAEAAEARGYGYIAITDHSQGLKIAGGINERELAEQRREIDAVNAQDRSVRVLHSVEMNLNPAGQGDLAQEALDDLDLVVGAFHSSLRKTDDQTARYLAALRNPAVQILAHPRGRIYNYRPGLSADWEKVFAAAAALDKAVEIDAYPDRQDLSVELLALARKEGCRISLGTDAHHPWQLEFMVIGLAHALLAGIPRARILNFMDCDSLLAWAARSRLSRRSRGGSAA
jgi:histidinol phosphatase-like PHP family hydrolase